MCMPEFSYMVKTYICKDGGPKNECCGVKTSSYEAAWAVRMREVEDEPRSQTRQEKVEALDWSSVQPDHSLMQ